MPSEQLFHSATLSIVSQMPYWEWPSEYIGQYLESSNLKVSGQCILDSNFPNFESNFNFAGLHTQYSSINS